MVRFEEVPPPLEERVGQSLLARVRDAVALGIDARNRFNASVHDEELKERTASAVFDAMRPGTAPFVLLMATILAMLVHQLLLHDIAGAFHDGVAHLRKRIVSIHARLAMHARVCVCVVALIMWVCLC